MAIGRPHQQRPLNIVAEVPHAVHEVGVLALERRLFEHIGRVLLPEVLQHL